MTFSKAKREFDIRYYLWAISEFEKEIEESFPTLRLFKAGGPWKTYQFMLKLDALQKTIDDQLRSQLPGLRDDPFTFRVYTYQEYLTKANDGIITSGN